MYKIQSLLVFIFLTVVTNAQDSEGNFLKDNKTGCTVWFKRGFAEDSVCWSGSCKNGLASGNGQMFGFTHGKQTYSYTGEMQEGKAHGKGLFIFGNNRKLEGNFSHGEPLFLGKNYLKHLQKQLVSDSDSSNVYVSDNNKKQLYYHALVPQGKIKGALILLPGTWETTEHLISSTRTLHELAFKQNFIMLSLSINQRITLTEEIVITMNRMISDAITRYSIPKDKIVLGGWSMGGLFSLRYTELSNQDSGKTVIKPAAVFSCDGPSDLINIYQMFENKLKKFPDNSEASYGVNELKTYCGGTPDEARSTYIFYSVYTHSAKDGGNVKYLLKTPVRIYNDIDPNWWMQNRGLDMYSMNGLDQTAMIQWLNDKGNSKAEFINAYQKGYRIEGYRHPHSWSIVDPDECLQWILGIFNP